jgi:hypothetical protein
VLQLTLSIWLHAGLGIALASIVWGIGFGVLDVVRRAGLPVEPAGVFAYPAGLLLALLACLAELITPWLGAVGAAAVLLATGAAVRSREALAPAVRHAAATVVWALPAVVGVPVVLGFFLHGPTSRVDSNAFGDVVWYAAKLASARVSLFPLRDLAAAGIELWRAELGPTLLGGIVTRLPRTDPILFHTTLLPTFALVSVCVGLSLLPPAARPGASNRVALALLATAAVAYPTWLAESPPVALALPLAFPIYVLAFYEVPASVFASGAALVAVDLAWTKGLLLLPFAILVVFAVCQRYRPRERWIVGVVAGAVLAIVALVAWALENSFWVLRTVHLRFAPLTAYHGLRSQLETRSTMELAPALELAGYVLVAIALLRARHRALAVALLVCLAWSWTLTGYSIAVGLGMCALLAAIAFRDASLSPIVAAAAVCLASATWFRDFAGLRAALIATACLSAVFLSAFTTSASRQRREQVSSHAVLYALLAAIAVVALSGHSYVAAGLAVAVGALCRLGLARPVAAAGLAAVALVIGLSAHSLRLGTYDTTILPSEQYDIWHRVETLVPRTGLVFTSMTGSDVTAATGLNYYPAISKRQIYIAGWYQSRLSTDRDELTRRLRQNAAVLDGEVSPQDIDVHRAFSSFFAVLPRIAVPPRGFRRLYANRLYALYLIRG